MLGIFLLERLQLPQVSQGLGKRVVLMFHALLLLLVLPLVPLIVLLEMVLPSCLPSCLEGDLRLLDFAGIAANPAILKEAALLLVVPPPMLMRTLSMWKCSLVTVASLLLLLAITMTLLLQPLQLR